jgi:hypothetical protein
VNIHKHLIIKENITNHYSGPGERMRPDGTTPVAGPLSSALCFKENYMELTPINLLLIILFAPCIFIAIFMFLIAPLLRKVLDQGRPIENQTKEENKRFREELKEKRRNIFQSSYPYRPTKDEINQFRKETNTLLKSHRLFLRRQLKKLFKVANKETGFTDVITAIKVSDGTASTLWYLGSLFLMPVILLLVNLATVVFGFPWQEPVILIMLLITPILGIFFAFRGYEIYRKKPAVVLCIVCNCIYFFPTYYVAISTLGKS